MCLNINMWVANLFCIKIWFTPKTIPCYHLQTPSVTVTSKFSALRVGCDSTESDVDGTWRMFALELSIKTGPVLLFLIYDMSSQHPSFHPSIQSIHPSIHPSNPPIHPSDRMSVKPSTWIYVGWRSEEWKDRWMDGLMDGMMDGLMDRRTDGEQNSLEAKRRVKLWSLWWEILLPAKSRVTWFHSSIFPSFHLF